MVESYPMRIIALLVIGLLLFAGNARSQSLTYWQNSNGTWIPTSVAAPIPVNVVTGGGIGGTSSTFGAAFPSVGTAIGLSDGTNMLAFRGDNSNGLWVNCKTGCSGGPADESTFTPGTTGITTGGFFQTTATNNALTTGQAGSVQMTATRAFFTNLRNAAGAEVGTSGAPLQVTLANTGANATAVKVDGTGGSFPVSGTVAVTQSTSPWIIAGAGTAGTAATGVVTVQGIASMTKLLVTPDSVALPANQSVNVSQIGGTNAINGGVAGSQSIGGTVATNVAITANPVNLGAQAVSSENAAVTTVRQVQLVADLVGKLIVLPYANPENSVSGVITSAMTGTTSTSLIAAPASGLRNYITQCTFSNSHASQGTMMILQDGSGGTTIYSAPAAPAFGGATITFPTPLRQPTTATALYVANVTTGANTFAACSGYKGA